MTVHSLKFDMFPGQIQCCIESTKLSQLNMLHELKSAKQQENRNINRWKQNEYTNFIE